MNSKVMRLIRKREAERKGTNVTRLYNYVEPIANGEVRIDTYAVKTDPANGKLVTAKVARYYTDRRHFYVSGRVMQGNTVHTHVINWSDKHFGHRHQAVFYSVDNNLNKWVKLDYSYCDSNFRLWGKFLNGFEGTKYERCGYNTEIWNPKHFLQYAECWNISKATEFLYKADMDRFISPQFIRRLLADKGLMQYFRSSMQILKAKPWHGIKDVLRAYYTHDTLANANFVNSNLWEFKEYLGRIPKSVDRKELFKWMEGNGVMMHEYCQYIEDLGEVEGMSITDFGMMYPTSRTMNSVAEAAYQVRLRRDAEKNRIEAAKRRREAKERLAHWKTVLSAIKAMEGKVYGGMELVIPKNNTQMKREGEMMHNCIGQVYRYKDHHNIIFFLHKDGKPFCDVRLNVKSFELAEARLKNNEDAPKKIKDIAMGIAMEMKSNYETRKAA